MRSMAVDLGKIALMGGKIEIKCTSITGELMRISTHEFTEKIMCYNFVN